MERILVANDVKIDTKEILANNLLRAIDICIKDNPVIQDFEFHIIEDTAFNDNVLKENDIYFIMRRLNATTLYDNDIIPYTIYVYVNTNFVQYARLILDTMCDIFSGSFQEPYYTYWNKNKEIITVPQDQFNKSDVLSGEESNIVSSWANETFEKSTIFNAQIPSGAFYYATLMTTSSFVINKNISGLDISNLVYKEEGKEDCPLQIIQATLSFNISLDSQPFFLDEKGNVNEFVKSEAKYGSFTLSLIVPLKKNIFTDKIIDIITQQRKVDSSKPSINSDFIFSYQFLNGVTNENKVFKLVDVGYKKTLGEADSISVSFSN